MEYPVLCCKDLTKHSPVRKEALISSLSAIQIQIVEREGRGAFGIVLLDNVEKIKEALEVAIWFSSVQKKSIVILFDHEMYRSDLIWQLLVAGASQVYDFENTPFLHRVIEEQVKRWQTVESLMQTNFVKEHLLGESPAWKSTVRELIEVAVFTQSSVLIEGESGTGKEMLSRLIHHLDNCHCKNEMVLVDCSVIAPELSGSEFFGHEKGAFTGAQNSREGAFSLANEGTLFLDEVGELPIRLQPELLRVIQDGAYKPVGSNTWKKSTFRLVCATNRSLSEEVTAGRFRLDLFYRLSNWICKVPSLAERTGDIPLLAKAFLKRCFGKKDAPPMDDSVIEYLSNRTYSGNVRELQQLVQRIANRHVGDCPIMLSDIPIVDRPALNLVGIIVGQRNTAPGDYYEKVIQEYLDQGLDLKEIKKFAGRIAIELAIKCEKGSVARAASRLGITPRSIQQNRLWKKE
jgi:transcriptional regulator with GAF, ATPase, and Fis domain